MAHDRTGTGRFVWIKTVGTADDQLETQWLVGRGYLLESVWFPKYPRSIRLFHRKICAGSLLDSCATFRSERPRQRRGRSRTPSTPLQTRQAYAPTPRLSWCLPGFRRCST